MKIQAVKNDQDTAESREVPVRVDEDRKYEIEAAIVRIMKHNRTMQVLIFVFHNLVFIFTIFKYFSTIC